jgi:hypothetical protein
MTVAIEMIDAKTTLVAKIRTRKIPTRREMIAM